MESCGKYPFVGRILRNGFSVVTIDGDVSLAEDEADGLVVLLFAEYSVLSDERNQVSFCECVRSRLRLFAWRSGTFSDELELSLFLL